MFDGREETEGQTCPCGSIIETNKRNPSKYVAEERLMVHFLKRDRKMLNAGELAEPRISQFLELLALCEKYKRVNQWM